MRPTIYLFGDSITEASFADGGWGAALANHFCRTVHIDIDYQLYIKSLLMLNIMWVFWFTA